MTNPSKAALLVGALLLAGCGGVIPGDGRTGGGGTHSGACQIGGQAVSGGGTVSTRGASPTAAPDWQAPRVAGQVLVEDAGGLSAQALRALSTVQTLRLEPGVLIALTPSGEGDAAFASRLGAAGLRTQPNFLYQPLAVPNDPGYPGNGGVPVGTGRYDQDYLVRIRAPGAWAALAAAGQDNAGVVTAVLDTGVDAGHPDLAGRLLPGCSFGARGEVSEGASEVSADSPQDRGHGTGVAGLIGAATNNALGVAGVTWQGRNVLPLKVLADDGASTASIRAALNHAVGRGAKVINMSLGAPGDFGDQLLKEALTRAARSAVLVAAAGNTSSQGIYFPASDPNVIAVGAVGRADSLACYSARPGGASGSRQLDIVAPGGNGGTSATVTNDVGPNEARCRVTSEYDVLTLTARDRGSYTLRLGTSEAAPLVSGVASLMWAANPGLSAAQVKARLLGSSRTVNGLKLLDAEAAVKAALR
ncbi:Subtilase family protein [Deinococcus reticulitermitis]|uniref:Subtilase family protein n=1 Tax=Deinococcus reticulitermitis TaxID=856736 RepID=A0A1H6Y2M8_9DEIO|nr:S8 family serine peptidase [Deinococcus reticulitermitis]SEJ33297.1 Subtilase family protein [Deinococcus reticulitermitis]